MVHLCNRWTTLSLFLIAYLAMSAGNLAEAATKESLSYTIKRVWIDSDNLYLLYEKKLEKIRYSLADIHGTIEKEENKLLLKRVPIGDVGVGGESLVNLENGEDASLLIYRDNDFDISTVGTNVKLIINETKKVFPRCNEPVWSSQDVIRVRERLLFCGMIFADDQLLKIPTAVALSVEQYSHTQGNLLLPLVSLSAISNNNLLIVSPDLGVSVSEFQIGIWPLTADKEVKWVKSTLPYSPGGYRFDNHRDYSPAGFVLRPVADGANWVLLCDEVGCKQASVRSQYSILAVDQEKKRLIEIEPRYTSHPSVRYIIQNIRN